MIPVTTFFIGILLLVQVPLGVRVSIYRGKHDIGLGDGGDATLLKHMRAHGNFIEYVPIILLGMAASELFGMEAFWLWIAGALLVAARIVHALSIYDIGGAVARGFGAGTTYLLMAIFGVYLAGHSIGIF